jgi:hypothetical protein
VQEAQAHRVPVLVDRVRALVGSALGVAVAEAAEVRRSRPRLEQRI